MYNLILILASLTVYFIYTLLKINKDIHMLQLNSYMFHRYTKWLSENKARVIRVKDFLPVISILFLFIGKINIFFILWILTYAALILTRDKRKEKKKLVYTARVKRLFSTIAIVFILIVIILFARENMILKSGYLAAAFLVLMILNVLSSAMVLLGNLINKPIEKSIVNYYYNDAYKKLRAMSNLTVIGITGSYGKTSTKHIVAKVLSKKFNVLMTPESYNTTLGVVRTIREYLKPTHEIFIAEMGAKKKGDIKEICDLVSPKFGILTSVGEQHLETFKSLENIKDTKYELIQALPKDGKGFKNMDDENIRSIVETNICENINYGIEEKNLAYRAVDIKFNGKGSKFTVIKPDGSSENFQTKLLGRHNIYNIVAATAVASELGMDLKTISYAVRDLEPIEHRLQLRKRTGNVTIIDDAFNSNPVGSKMALEVLKAMEANKKIMVTPGMVELGEKEFELNKNFGKYAAEACDYVILVGKKQTVPIQEGLKEKGYSEKNLFVASNLDEAIAHLNTIVEDGTVVLFENDLPDTYNE